MNTFNKLFLLLFLIILWTACAWSLGFAKQPKNRDMNSIHLEIADLSRQIQAQKTAETNGFLNLRFLNCGGETVRIFLSLPAGKGMSKRPTADASIQTNRGTTSVGGDFANVSYTWTKHGTEVLSRDVPIGGVRAIIIKPLQYESIFVPVELPRDTGEYKFHVRFDNRKLETEALTYNDWDSTQNAFFEKTAEMLIKLK